MDINYEKVGLRIGQRRRELKLKQEDLANALGISSKYLSALETGRRNTTLEMLAAMCQELHATYDYFMLGNIRKDIDSNIMDSLMLCTQEDKEMIISLVNYCAARNKNNLTK